MSAHAEPSTEASRVMAVTRAASPLVQQEDDAMLAAGQMWGVDVHVRDRYGNATHLLRL